MRVWTEEQKQKQREAIRRWAPWTKSTGPLTEAGKRTSSQNAVKHGMYSRTWREIRSYLYQQRRYRRAIERQIKSLRKRKATNKLLSRAQIFEDFFAPPSHFFAHNRTFPAIKGLP